MGITESEVRLLFMIATWSFWGFFATYLSVNDTDDEAKWSRDIPLNYKEFTLKKLTQIYSHFSAPGVYILLENKCYKV